MGVPNPRLDRFFHRDAPWRPELRALRAVVLDGPVEEDLRWRQPCYRAHDANIAIVSAMKDCAVVSFLKGALLDDPDGVLVAPGQNSRSARMVKVTSVAQVEGLADTIRGFVRQAVENEAAGRKVAMEAGDFDWPPELRAAFDDDPGLREAFETLTPGRRRGWLIHFTGAKQSKTVVSRIEKAAPKIRAGKGMQD
ncbi:YdeI/OmpD-associated family protein [Paracoccus sp. TK19116]|uniref:YdeI/OmpD-associated family protein n=1 Tax=Paracoccus albicereus TaxID=2922394 RepID=A0ABT1MTK5_9RHOB|nr:YdeI/OmpD-associated family protein [Paracoccus albicereus]MCQ0971654.1 YdeI/OmpD-associated family protein [Paracoccus albicereus]